MARVSSDFGKLTLANDIKRNENEVHANRITVHFPLSKAGVGNVDPGGPVSLQSLAPTLIKHTWTR